MGGGGRTGEGRRGQKSRKKTKSGRRGVWEKNVTKRNENVAKSR